MRKLFVFALISLILFFTFPKQGVGYQTIPEETYQVIPDEAIRLRILANSDKEADQRLKRLIRDQVSEQISGWVDQLTDIDEARHLIKSRIKEVEAMVASVLVESNSNYNLQVDYGENVTFPVKLYDSFLYPAGEYEAVLITLGAGKGANWWCVLFPPLCFLDFSSGTTVSETSNEEVEEAEEGRIKIKFFLFEWFGWT